MSKIIIPQGTKFGRLTVIGEADNINKQTAWRCQCECGTQVTIRTGSLRRGHTKSCGCLQTDTVAKRLTIHSMCGTSEYRSWYSMKARCYNQNDKAYANYGGRGITVCNKWKDSFETFYADMGSKPKGTTLDRINNDGNYEPSNCKWSSMSEQGRNRRTNRLIEYKKEIKTIVEWSEELNIPYSAIRNRLDSGWPIERAFTEPVRSRA